MLNTRSIAISAALRSRVPVQMDRSERLGGWERLGSMRDVRAALGGVAAVAALTLVAGSCGHSGVPVSSQPSSGASGDLDRSRAERGAGGFHPALDLAPADATAN